MKLIHLPTGKEMDATDKFYQLVNHYEYIRATLPEYWRVEGYDKSWEWCGVLRYCFVTNKDESNAFYKEVRDKSYMQLPQISRAEFEYHIYKPWKKVQNAMKQLEKGIENSRLNKQNDISDLDTLKQQAEKMGYELVKKEISWEGCYHKYYLKSSHLTITDTEGHRAFNIENAELDTLIEKYNQFKSNP